MNILSQKYSIALAFVLASFSSLSSHADQVYICTHHDAVREIHVTYEFEDQSVPCEVLYRKAEGEQVLWSAQAEEGYCEQKAEAFVEKQRGWGWACDLAAEEDGAVEESTEAAIESTEESEADDSAETAAE